jgi:hypothetical protein
LSAKLEEGHLRRIQDKMALGKVVLFLGAGASIAAGAPSSEELTEIVKKRFPSVSVDSSDFMKVCNEVLETDGVDRRDLENLIVGQFDTLSPTETHKEMTKYDWAAIFTTNFDDLIEAAYTDKRRLKPCLPVSADDIEISPNDRSKVYLFKLMGSIRATPEGGWNLVLSSSDHHRALKRRYQYLQYLEDFVKDGTIVFIGYSGQDQIVFETIDDVLERVEITRLPYSYALFKELPPKDHLGRYTKRKIIPVQCSFEDFFDFVRGMPQITSPTVMKREPLSLTVSGIHLELDRERLGTYLRFGQLLSDDALFGDPGRMDDFFRGVNRNWSAFGKGWDFIRNLYSKPGCSRSLRDGRIAHGCLREKVAAELRSTDPAQNKVIVLTGIPGVGKTMLLRRLAFDFYSEGLCPVLVLDSSRWTFDLKLLDNVIVELNHARDSVAAGKIRERLKPLIVIDDAPSLMIDPIQIRDHFSSRSTPVLIVAAGRDNEWPTEWGDPRGMVATDDVFSIDPELDSDEKTRIVKHLYELGYLNTPDTAWDTIIETEFESSFFATIYSLVQHSRRPLNEILRDEYNSLEGLAQKAYLYICCLYQYNLAINLELLVRTLRCRYEELYADIIPKTEGVIFEEQDSEGNLLYSAHHRIVAERIIDMFSHKPDEQKALLLDILNSAHLGIGKEKEIIEKLMIGYLGPRALQSRYTTEDKRELFEAVCKSNQVPSLLHHYGILETDAGNFDKAEQLLKQALVSKRTYPFAGESERNILVSLGRFYSKLCQNLMKSGEASAAEEKLKVAEQTFVQARYVGPTNPYPYHAHAKMYYELSGIVKDQSERLRYLGEAYAIIEMAEDNLSSGQLKPIYELRTSLFTAIGDVSKVKESIRILKEKFKSPRGYSIYAGLLYQRALETPATRRAILEEALRTAEEGLRDFPGDEACARLRARITGELNPQDMTRRYESLKAWYDIVGNRRPNIWLLFELGVLAFNLDFHYESRDYFRQLERVTIRHGRRFAEVYCRDITGEPREFEGVVSNVETRYKGEIECTSVKKLRFPIYFRPLRCKFIPQRGDLVKFHVVFTFVGPQALDIVKVG